jgi:hypothetical protein
METSNTNAESTGGAIKWDYSGGAHNGFTDSHIMVGTSAAPQASLMWWLILVMKALGL